MLGSGHSVSLKGWYGKCSRSFLRGTCQETVLRYYILPRHGRISVYGEPPEHRTRKTETSIRLVLCPVLIIFTFGQHIDWKRNFGKICGKSDSRIIQARQSKALMEKSLCGNRLTCQVFASVLRPSLQNYV
jgi:hypothetical protein